MNKFIFLVICFVSVGAAQTFKTNDRLKVQGVKLGVGTGETVASSWVSPTGKTDDAWTNTVNMYDGDTATKGTCSTNGLATTLTIGALTCSKVRIYCGLVAGGQTTLEIAVYYSGGWNIIHDGLLAEDTWVELEIGSTQSVTAVNIKMNAGINTEVGEFEFYDAS